MPARWCPLICTGASWKSNRNNSNRFCLGEGGQPRPGHIWSICFVTFWGAAPWGLRNNLPYRFIVSEPKHLRSLMQAYCIHHSCSMHDHARNVLEPLDSNSLNFLEASWLQWIVFRLYIFWFRLSLWEPEQGLLRSGERARNVGQHQLKSMRHEFMKHLPWLQESNNKRTNRIDAYCVKLIKIAYICN